MKATALILAVMVLLVAVIGVPWAIGVNVAFNGRPTVWGGCK